jgi:predicted dienelactone hydrolase
MFAVRASSLAASAILLAALCVPAIASANCSATHAVRSVNKTYTDTARANRRVGVTVHYPTASSSSSTIVNGCGFPIVSFGHGFTIGNNAYAFVPQRLVPAGYVVVMPSTEGGLSPNHGRFADDLAFAIRAVRNDPAFAGAVGPNSAIGGHSMGGGAAVLGASRNASINALFGFAPAETNPTASGAATSVTMPAMIITGTRDCVTPYAQHAGRILSNLATPPALKFDVPINGASHCGFTTGSFTCSIGERSCGGSATIPAASQHAQTMDFLKLFLDAELK